MRPVSPEIECGSETSTVNQRLAERASGGGVLHPDSLLPSRVLTDKRRHWHVSTAYVKEAETVVLLNF